LSASKQAAGAPIPASAKRNLNPGEQGTLEIAFDSAGYSGKVTRTITVCTNVPESREVKLKIIANVTVPAEK
jgi:hypothetical protein